MKSRSPTALALRRLRRDPPALAGAAVIAAMAILALLAGLLPRSPARFEPGDFKDFQGFAAALKEARRPAARFLAEGLDAETGALLRRYDPSRPPSSPEERSLRDALERALAQTLNRAVSGPSLLGQAAFRDARLSEEAKGLAALRPRGRGLERLNRLLLNAAFPREISKSAERAYEKQVLANKTRPPSAVHPFGTDDLGRDLFARVLFGTRVSLTVAAYATTVSLLIGLSWGTVAGLAGGRTDEAMMRTVDVLYGLPFVLFVVVLMVLFDRSFVCLFIGLGAVQWLTTARIVRGQVLSLKAREFVAAARALGAGPTGLAFRHLIPNLLGPVVTYATLTVPAVILEEALLSYLGLGVQPPRASWGSLLHEASQRISFSEGGFPWWFLAFPGGFLSLTLLSFNFLGEGLRGAFFGERRG